VCKTHNLAQVYTGAQRRGGWRYDRLRGTPLFRLSPYTLPFALSPVHALTPSAAAVVTAATAAWAWPAFVFVRFRSRPGKPHTAPHHPTALPPLALLPTATFSGDYCIRFFSAFPFLRSGSFSPVVFQHWTSPFRCLRHGDSFSSTVSAHCRSYMERTADASSLASFRLYVHVCAAAGGVLGSVDSIDLHSASTCARCEHLSIVTGVFGNRYSDECTTRRVLRAERVYIAGEIDLGTSRGSMWY
jgi:hypothetical protein